MFLRADSTPANSGNCFKRFKIVVRVFSLTQMPKTSWIDVAQSRVRVVDMSSNVTVSRRVESSSRWYEMRCEILDDNNTIPPQHAPDR